MNLVHNERDEFQVFFIFLFKSRSVGYILKGDNCDYVSDTLLLANVAIVIKKICKFI